MPLPSIELVVGVRNLDPAAPLDYSFCLHTRVVSEHSIVSASGPSGPCDYLEGCIICRQNDPNDTSYPIDVIAENPLWLVHHQYFNNGTWGQPDAEAVGPISLPGHLMFHVSAVALASIAPSPYLLHRTCTAGQAPCTRPYRFQ